MKIFVSYQRSDCLFAAHMLGYALRAAGNDSFVDTGSITGSAAFLNQPVLRKVAPR
jgi:hypothetical protein